MKVLLINGSPNENGNTFLALRECAAEMEKRGIETEIYSIGNRPVRGCIACHSCRKTGACAFTDDALPELVEKMAGADGIIVGSPTYYAGPNGALCALLDRAFFSASGRFRGKPASAVAVCRRGGATTALDRLNKYFTINEMPLISSQYWNIIYGSQPGEVLRDAEGMQTMRTLGKNMALAVQNLPASLCERLDERRCATNFIR